MMYEIPFERAHTAIAFERSIHHSLHRVVIRQVCQRVGGELGNDLLRRWLTMWGQFRHAPSGPGNCLGGWQQAALEVARARARV